MRRRLLATIAALGIVGALVATATPALAQAPKFHRADSSVADDAALVVTFDERGLGNEDIDYVLSADGEATYACFNRGGKNPSATNKRTVSQEVSQEATFEPRNGRVQASIEAGPPSPGDFRCPSGQRMELIDVSYTNVVLTDTTNDVSTSVEDASRTFRDA
ncbi:MAG TPA: hypothetical protein VNP73_06340 [Actinomycetota bacterium]|nr:hypothetical protein [Actinomycetota bacterium]